MTYVIFEWDSKLVVETVNSNSSNQIDFADIIPTCKDLFLSHTNHMLCYVMRQTNKITYKIVRASLSHPSIIFFREMLFEQLFNGQFMWQSKYTKKCMY